MKFMIRTQSLMVVFAATLAFCLLGGGTNRVMAESGAAFVSGTEDLPLMTGLVEAPEGKMVFDTPVGRIVESYASGSVTRPQVINFYAATLPQLGWRRLGEAAFVREEELLRLEFSSAESAGGGSELTVRFSLSPAGKAADQQ